MRRFAILNALVCFTLYALLLSGCFHADSARLMCGAIVNYSEEAQHQAAAELAQAERAGVSQPNVNRLIDDYHKLRQAAKACR